MPNATALPSCVYVRVTGSFQIDWLHETMSARVDVSCWAQSLIKSNFSWLPVYVQSKKLDITWIYHKYTICMRILNGKTCIYSIVLVELRINILWNMKYILKIWRLLLFILLPWKIAYIYLNLCEWQYHLVVFFSTIRFIMVYYYRKIPIVLFSSRIRAVPNYQITFLSQLIFQLYISLVIVHSAKL